MRIMSIQSTNFKGLWGEPTVKHTDNTGTDHGQMLDYGERKTETTKIYYPFADETKKEIDKVVKENTLYKEIRADKEDTERRLRLGYWIDDTVDIEDTKVKVMPKLAFTAKEFAAYQARELLSKAEMALEDALKIAKLQKYLRR